MGYKFNYEDIQLKNKNVEGELGMVQFLVHKFLDLKSSDGIATENNEYELKLTLHGSKEVELDVTKLLNYLENYGEKLEQENKKLKNIVENIKYDIVNFIDGELNNI